MLCLYLSTINYIEKSRKFEILYLTYRQTMYNTAYSILKNKMSAEDTVHQAFIRILSHFDQINLENSHKTKSFLVVITEHIAIDLYRKQKRENLVSYDEIGELYIHDNTFRNNNEVLEAIMRLPISYSTVIRLKYIQGFTNKEIAALLQITIENVRQRIYRGEKKLEQLLKSESLNESQ